MIKIKSFLLSLLLACLLMGATYNNAAPVLPTKDYYINDLAGLLFREHASELSEIAEGTFNETGIQFVVLTVVHLGGMDIDEYAEAIATGWGIGAPSGQGILLLVDRGSRQGYFHIGEGLNGTITPQELQSIQTELLEPFVENENYSTGITNAYKEVSRTLYRKAGIAVPATLEEQPKSTKKISTASLVVVAVAFLALGRSLYVTHKYRKKYLYRHEYKRRNFSGKQFRDDDINPKDLRTNPHVYQKEEPNTHRSGFIIYRDPVDDDDTTTKSE